MKKDTSEFYDSYSLGNIIARRPEYLSESQVDQACEIIYNDRDNMDIDPLTLARIVYDTAMGCEDIVEKEVYHDSSTQYPFYYMAGLFLITYVLYLVELCK